MAVDRLKLGPTPGGLGRAGPVAVGGRLGRYTKQRPPPERRLWIARRRAFGSSSPAGESRPEPGGRTTGAGAAPSASNHSGGGRRAPRRPAASKIDCWPPCGVTRGGRACTTPTTSPTAAAGGDPLAFR